MMSNDKMSRGDFLRSGFKTMLDISREAAASMNDSSEENPIVKVVRPPGAIAEVDFLVRCSRCDACTIACPHDAIKPCGKEYGAAIGTPLMIFDINPCEMCSDMPCIASCDDKALVPNEYGDTYKIGYAVVLEDKCIAHQGQDCVECFEKCPEKGKAITMEDGRPNVIQNKCTGCGKCQHYCPAPENGIMILPFEE